MLLAFNASMAMLISVLVTFLTGVIFIVQGNYFHVPYSIGVGLMILSAVGMSILLSSVRKLYGETLKRCHDDLEGFLKEQKTITKRSVGKKRTDAKLNVIIGLLAHEYFEEADTLLLAVAPIVEKSREPLHRLQYLLCRLDIYRYRRDEEGYRYTLETLFSAIRELSGLSPLERVEYENMARQKQLEALFFMSPSQESSELAKKLHLFSRICLAQTDSEAWWSEYLSLHLHYVVGVTYAALGDENSARFYFDRIASLPFTYPEIGKARQYLQTGSTPILF